MGIKKEKHILYSIDKINIYKMAEMFKTEIARFLM